MVIAFDGKEYRREKFIEGERRTVFYTPLGVGVKIPDVAEFETHYIKTSREKRKSHAVLDIHHIYNITHLRKKYGEERTISFLESILYSLRDKIDEVFISYAILPPDKIPEITVGGTGCSTSTISTSKFLVQLNPMFSYLTAWKYLVRNEKNTDELYIDSFSSKQTLAWEYLKTKNPKIFRRGDEVNIPISIADMIAYLTDKKLDKNHLRLEPENISAVWEKYGFNINVRFLSHTDLRYYKWYNYNEIDWVNYQARPILFIDGDTFNMSTLSELDAYPAAIAHASKKGGSIQGFDPNMDIARVKDGDIFVYAGEKARLRALALKDIYDIEIITLKELRQLEGY